MKNDVYGIYIYSSGFLFEDLFKTNDCWGQNEQYTKNIGYYLFVSSRNPMFQNMS